MITGIFEEIGVRERPSQPAKPIAETRVKKVVTTIAITPEIARKRMVIRAITKIYIRGVCVFTSLRPVSAKLALIIVDPVT